jgi:DNA mismatch repair protein MutS2
VRIYDNNTYQLFEFDKIKKFIEAHCRNASSKRIAKNLEPIEDRELCKIQLQQLHEYVSLYRNKGYFPDILFQDFEPECNLLSVAGTILTEKQFVNIKNVSLIVNDVYRFINEREVQFPFMKLLLQDVYVTQDIVKAIEKIIDETAQVRSSASRTLADIRHELSSKRREAERKFRQFINDLNKLGWLRENEENFYNGRRVLAVMAEHKRDVKGIVHGSSDTGKTSFIEPNVTVELNNDIAELEGEERREIYKLLRELTQNLRPFAELIKNYHVLLTQLDFIRAKALFAIEINGHHPIIENEPCIEVYNAVHPILFLQNKEANKKTIPMSLHLHKTQRIIIISGPNAGGKSITLKTIGLMQLMLQSALLISCESHSKLSFFNHLLVDIGDSQSIENELSTYSSRLIAMKKFLQIANRRTLFLIDEFGTGTDPELGGAIAEVILEELNKKQAYGIITTHYTNIKLLADNLKGVSNASMLFNPETLEPKYELLVGQPGSSYTFEVAEKIGLPTNIIQRASDKISSDKVKLNRLLADVQREKNRLEEEAEALKQQQEQSIKAKEKYDALYQKLMKRFEKSKEEQEELNKVNELGRKFQVLAEEWQQNKDKKVVIQKFVNKLTEEKRKKQEQLALERREKTKDKAIAKAKLRIRVGGKVRILKSHQTGIVQEIIEDKARVTFGMMKSVIGLENLEPVD